jgi:hypothetical protein
MQRLLRLKTPWLALVFSIAAEVAFCSLAFVAGRTGRTSEPVLLRCWDLFHGPADAFSLWCIHQVRWHNILSAGPEIIRSIIFFLIVLAQWYIVFLIAISLYKNFSSKTT